MPLFRRHEPILAIATAPGRAAVGIVRVSGGDLRSLVRGVVGRDLVPRHATLAAFLDRQGRPIDQGLALFFQAPASFTGEDVLELQAHGGTVVLQLLLARCLEAATEFDPATGGPRLPGLRLAEPGEFTERAFLNDKIDLAQAEAVADLIEASTEAAARSAGRSLAGEFSLAVGRLHERIVALRLLVEATLDFPEEEIDFLQAADAQGQLDGVLSDLDALLERAQQGALLREGLRVVLAGQPNVGKSSLLNALAGAELAIVTPIPGTTRDKVSETIQIEGVPIHVIDTAGLRDDTAAPLDEVERIGIERSWQAIQEADAVIFLHDLTRRGQPDYEAAEALIAERLHLDDAKQLIHVHNKSDAAAGSTGESSGVVISARTGDGLEALRRELLECAGWHASPDGVFIARKRHLLALERTRTHLLVARQQAAERDTALDLYAEELRLAHDALAEITGAFTSDDLLGEIFGRFCIGK